MDFSVNRSCLLLYWMDSPKLGEENNEIRCLNLSLSSSFFIYKKNITFVTVTHLNVTKYLLTR